MLIPRATFLAVILMLSGPLAAVGIGEIAPDFNFDRTWNTPAGKSSLDDYRGDVVLLEFWATW